MKKIIFMFATIVLFLAGIFSACKETEECKNLYRDNIIGQWKLIGFADTFADIIKITEPESEKCYLISFNKDKKVLAVGGCNTLIGNYDINYITSNINIYDIDVTIVYCPTYYDEDLYFKSLSNVNFFSIQEDKLRLYYNNGQNYLLFKIQQQ